MVKMTAKICIVSVLDILWQEGRGNLWSVERDRKLLKIRSAKGRACDDIVY